MSVKFCTSTYSIMYHRDHNWIFLMYVFLVTSSLNISPLICIQSLVYSIFVCRTSLSSVISSSYVKMLSVFSAPWKKKYAIAVQFYFPFHLSILCLFTERCLSICLYTLELLCHIIHRLLFSPGRLNFSTHLIKD